jgi:hypothetical protein
MNIRTITLDQEHYLNKYAEHIPCPSGSSSAMDVVVLGIECVMVLQPSGHHRHCSGMACLKESVTYGRRPSIRRKQNLDQVCWVLDLTKNHWSLSEADAPLLYTLLGLGLQPWSGLRLWSRRAKFRSTLALHVIIFLGFSLFWILNILSYFCEIYFTLPRFPGFWGKPKRSPLTMMACTKTWSDLPVFIVIPITVADPSVLRQRQIY